ncbi:Cupredoxin [Penicillium griseofulvum]|uniref:Cupredoxin n=1 Tax=Penicillium patulum TaxID=5078 RepID=A0A135LZ96_PENPA|nr:Cupredoxin [Penicillium griseofulvum]KXG54284.1 Cupredoxin [Penicillium griseofulvum]
MLSQLVRPLAWLALATITVAQSSRAIPTRSDVDSSSTATSTSTGITTHTIQAGPKSDPHQFSPTSIKAKVGDIVVFEFYPTNHSVVQAEYLAPCVPASGNIFYSEPFADFNLHDGQLVGPPPTWSLRVNNTEPTFFYCTAVDSCIKNGMVGVINPNSTQTWQTQYAKALKYPYMLVPGQAAPPEGETPGSGDGDDEKGGDGKHGLSTGAIAGIAVAAVVFVALLVALFFVLGRNRVYSQWMSSEDGRTERTARWAMFNHGDGGKSDIASTVPSHKPGHIDMTAVSSPDPTVRTLSPGVEVHPPHGSPSAQQGHWSWNEPQPQPQPQPQPYPRAHTSVVATELEGHPMIWEAPGSTPGQRF